MAVRLILLLLFSFSLAFSQNAPQEKRLKITQLGGLNTRQGDFSIAPNNGQNFLEFRQLDGWDLNRNPGSLTPRFGYDSVITVTGLDSLIGIYAALYSDGRKRLFYVGDSSGQGFGTVSVTGFDVFGQTQIAAEWPIIYKPTFATFRDKVYITNGSGRGLVYDNEIVRPFPLYAPAEPKIIPLNTSGNLDGEYIYVFKFRVPDDSTFIQLESGEPSQRIKVQDGQVLLKDFTWIPGIQGDTSPDSIRIRPYRTKANPGNLDAGDTAYWVGTDITATSLADLATKSFTDNVADGSLNADSFTTAINLTRTGFGVGEENAAYGAPIYIGQGNQSDSGNVKGTPANRWGYAYRYAVLDTATLLESPPSPPMFWQFVGTSNDSVVMVIPNPPTVITGYKINLYRSLVVYSAWDTTWITGGVAEAFSVLGPFDCYPDPNTGNIRCVQSTQPRYDPGTQKDSIYEDYMFLLAQLDEGDTLYSDTTGHDSVTADFRRLYDPSFPLSPMEGIVSLEDRLFGFYGSQVALSTLDSASRWFIFDRASVSSQDGQRINAIWGQRDALRIGKTKSLHNFYQTADTIWNLSEITHHVGVVAQYSVVQGIGGTYYYTDFGVMRETEGQFRDRQFGIQNISTKITALDTLPMSEKVTAIGTYHDQMYILSLPDVGDSGQSYVYFERVDAWARWPNLCLGGATLYSTKTGGRLLPPDTLYFFKQGSSVIYHMTADTLDNITAGGSSFRIGLVAETAPLLTDDLRFNKKITELGVGLRAATSSTDTLVVAYKNEEGVTQFTDTLKDSSGRYTLLGGKGNALFWKLNLQNGGTGSWSNTILDRLDIYYTETLKDVVK